jgi:hypothetical protein
MSSDWFENGELPPIGDVCEYASILNEGVWIKCKPMFFGEEQCVVYDLNSDREFSGKIKTAIFRPIKSDREKAIEAAHNILLEKGYNSRIMDNAIGHLYDAGLLRLPEDK